ncbi:hypothetical protein TNCV_2006531 [Trichonephila clavipes]|nr:hypothetical protein TNCV_2006531 [Trichonephila clavipes]
MRWKGAIAGGMGTKRQVVVEERTFSFDNSRNRRRNFDDVGTYADQTLLAVLRQVPREADPNSLQIPVAISPIQSVARP